MQDEIITLVDKNNQIIGATPRSKMRFGVDFHRATYILVFDKNQHLLVQKRTLNKSFCPGYYGIATGGVVASGESYIESAHRELQEELGFDAELADHGLFYTEGNSFRIWGNLYSCHYDESLHGPLRLQADEVASIHTMSMADIMDNPNQLLFTPDTLDALKHYVNKND